MVTCVKLCVGCNKLDISFGERERKIYRDPPGNCTQDLPITNSTLLSLSHWTHGRAAEASLLITSRPRGLSQLQLSFSLTQLNALPYFEWRSLSDRVANLGELTVHAHCLSRYSHYPHPTLWLNYLLTHCRLFYNRPQMLTSMQIANESISAMVLGLIPSWIPVDISFFLSKAYICNCTVLHCTFASTVSQIRLKFG